MFAGFTNVKDGYFAESILYLLWWEFVFVYLYLYLCICIHVFVDVCVDKLGDAEQLC